jgi:hypothetical protein
VLGQQVDDLPLAFVAPLGPDDHGRRHVPEFALRGRLSEDSLDMASAGDRIDRDWIERKQAVDAAKVRGDVEYLTRALTEPDHRGLAARALGELGAREAVPALLRLLEASDRSVRIDGIRALGDLRASEAVERLREVASNDPDPTVRGWACAVLADLGGESTLELTLPLLEDSSMTVRGSAAYTLGKLGDPRALGPLRAARPRPFRAPVEWWVYRQTYREAISAVKRRAAGKAPRTAAARRLRRARVLMQGAALVAAATTVWLYAGFWWSFWLVVALALGWLAMALLFFRKIPMGRSSSVRGCSGDDRTRADV